MPQRRRPSLSELAGALRRLVKPYVPQALLNLRVKRIVAQQRKRFSALGTQEAFERIYAERAWGSAPEGFCSGSGSAEHVTKQYVELVCSFVAKRGIKSIVDLGCGDFRVGQQLLAPGLQYVGVDIVRPLIERNRAQFGGEHVSFEVRNLIEDELPNGELALLRQVLQHLSNQQIERTLDNCSRYRYLLVTEHIPTGPRVAHNLDKPHGPDIRIYDNSGVFVDLPPFNRATEVLLETPVAPNEVLRTVLIESSR